MLFNLFNLLTSESTSASDSNGGGGNPYMTWIIMGVAIVLIVVMMVFSRRSQKKKQDELKATLDAIKPGNKVKTIGGICGVVVEVCNDDNTFILETGSEESGKSYLKLDKQSVFQTDAKATTENAAPVAEKVPATEEVFEDAPVAEETPATEEPAAEETPATEEKAE